MVSIINGAVNDDTCRRTVCIARVVALAAAWRGLRSGGKLSDCIGTAGVGICCSCD